MEARNNNLNISIPQEKIAQLIQQGHLCAADFKCLDSESKNIVWQLCLWCCEKRISCKNPCSSECNSQCVSKIMVTNT